MYHMQTTVLCGSLKINGTIPSVIYLLSSKNGSCIHLPLRLMQPTQILTFVPIREFNKALLAERVNSMERDPSGNSSRMKCSAFYDAMNSTLVES